MSETLVLDTNAFNERGFAYFLSRQSARKVLPAVAAAELFRHFRARRGWDRSRFMEELHRMGVAIEPLDAAKALAAIEVDERRFAEDPTDALIGAHALAPGRILVTNNLADFPQVPVKVTAMSLMRGR